MADKVTLSQHTPARTKCDVLSRAESPKHNPTNGEPHG